MRALILHKLFHLLRHIKRSALTFIPITSNKFPFTSNKFQYSRIVVNNIFSFLVHLQKKNFLKRISNHLF